MPHTAENDENQRFGIDNPAPNLVIKDAAKPTPLQTSLPLHVPRTNTTTDPQASAIPPTPNYLVSSPESAPGLSGSSRTPSTLESGPTTPEYSWAQGDTGFTLQQPQSSVYRPEQYQDTTSPSTVEPDTNTVASSFVRDFAYHQAAQDPSSYEAGPPRPSSQVTIRPISPMTAQDETREIPACPRTPPTTALSTRRSFESLQQTPPEYYDEAHWAAFRASREIPENRLNEGRPEVADVLRMPPDLRQPYVDPDFLSSTDEDQYAPVPEDSIFHSEELHMAVPSHLYARDMHFDGSDASTLDSRTITRPNQASLPSYVPYEEDADAILPAVPADATSTSDEAYSAETSQHVPLHEDWNALAALSMSDAADPLDETLDDFNRFREVAEEFGTNYNGVYEAVERYFKVGPQERRERMIGSLLRENDNSPWLSVGDQWRMSGTLEDPFDPRYPWLRDAYDDLSSWMASEKHQERLCKYLRERLVLSNDYSNELLDCFRPCIDRSPPTRVEKIKSALNAATEPSKRTREKARARKTLTSEDPDSPSSSASNTLRRISDTFNKNVSSPINQTVRETTKKIGKTARKVSGSLETLFDEFRDPVDDPSKYCEFCGQNGHEKPACPEKRRRENTLRRQAQEHAMKEIEAQPGFWKNKKYGAARLDTGPLSDIKLDTDKGEAGIDRKREQDDQAGPSPPPHGSVSESLLTYREMCTGCDKYGYGKDHFDHPLDFEGSPSKVDKGKGRARDPYSAYGYAFGSISTRSTCLYCLQPDHGLGDCPNFQVDQPNGGLGRQPGREPDQDDDQNGKRRHKADKRRRSEGSCKQQ